VIRIKTMRAMQRSD